MPYVYATIAVLLPNIFYLVLIILQLKKIFTSFLTRGLKLSFAAVSNVSCYHKLATGCSKAQFKRKGSLAGNYTTTNICYKFYKILQVLANIMHEYLIFIPKTR